MVRSVLALSVSTFALAAMTGCASMGWSSNQEALKKQVAFDHDCPAEKVQVVESAEIGVGHASFKVDACGQRHRYERMGASYFDTAKGTPVDQAMGKPAPKTEVTSATTNK